MINAIYSANLVNIEGVDTIEASHVVAVLCGRRPTLVMRVNSAPRTVVVLRRIRVESIKAQDVFSLHYPEACQWNRSGNVALAAANRAIAAPWIHDSVRKLELEHHGSTVTGCPVPGSNFRGPNRFELRDQIHVA